jgi:hypothetical protein
MKLPEADARRANAFVVNRQLIELINRWQGKKIDVSSEDTGAFHIKGPGLDFITKKANAALAGFDKKPDTIVGLLDAAETAKKEGKSLVLASDHTGNIQIGLVVEMGCDPETLQPLTPIS